MSIGYFIGRGDKTTYGGTVLEGDDTFSLFGPPHARVGDMVSCGKDGKTYQIIGGVTHILSDQRMVAGTLDSFSSCPRRAQLIPSNFDGSYTNEGTTARAAKVHAQSTPTPSESHSASSRPFSKDLTASNPSSKRLNNLAAQEPGFHIVPKSTTREQLEANLFTLRDPAVMGKFKLLNPNLSDVKAGSMIVLSDPNNYQCTRQEAMLMDVAAKTNRIIETLSPEEADFMVQHRDVIQSFLSHSSTVLGVGANIFKNNLDNVGEAIRDLEDLQKKTLQRDGNLRSPKFLAERQRLLAQLNTHLTKLTRKSIGIPDHVNLKKKLGISSQSLVHLWTEASPAGQIPGHGAYLEGVAKASKYVQYGGWLGTAIGGGVSALKVQEVCTAGSTEACKRVRLTEAGSFFVGVGGGMAAGWLLAPPVVGVLCVGLGIPTGGFGTLVCSIAVAGTGSYVGSTLGAKVGEMGGEIIYESTK